MILANGYSIPAFREVLFEHRDRWLGGREVGAVIDCKVFSAQAISPSLKPILEELKREIADCEREAYDERAWGHHRAYARARAAELRRQLELMTLARNLKR